jgi:hypothetical protein
MPETTPTAVLDAVATNRRLLDAVLQVQAIHGQLIADIHAAVTKEAPAETDNLGDILRHIVAVGDANSERLDALREVLDRLMAAIERR